MTLPIANVVKANALVESSYRLGVVEQRIILCCLSQVKKGEVITDDKFYTVSAKEIGDLSETESKTIYSELAAASQRLRRKDVVIHYHPNGEGKLSTRLETSWVQSCLYVESEGIIRLRFSRDMVPYLSELQRQFTTYPLSDVIRMTSAHAIRLFELLVQHSSIGKRDISISDFRAWFRLEDSYPLTNDLRRKVVEPAVQQINEYSSLVCKMTTVKSGRKVTHFRFTFASRKGARIQQSSQDEGAPLSRKRPLSDAEVSRLALPGESWEQARRRLESKRATQGSLL